MLQQIYHHFNDKLKHLGEPVIAGGAVRDYLLNREPRDYDIFILNGTPILTFLGKPKPKQSTFDDALSDYKHLSEVKVDPNNYGGAYYVYTIAYEGKKVQIVVTPKMAIDSLLKTFDYNICQFSYNTNGFYHLEKLENILPGNTLKLIHNNSPRSSLRRGYVFADRYELKFKDDDILKLAKEIVMKEGNTDNSAKKPLMEVRWITGTSASSKII